MPCKDTPRTAARPGWLPAELQAAQPLEEMAGALFEGIGEMAFVTDGSGRILAANACALQEFGYRRGELEGQWLGVLLPTQSRDRLMERLRRYLQSSAARPLRSWVRVNGRHVQGHQFPLEVKLFPFATAQARGTLVLGRHLSPGYSEEAVRAMQAQLEQQRIITDSTDEYAIYTLDAEGKVNSWGKSAERIIGYTAEEVMGKPFSIFSPQECVQAGEPERELEEARRNGRALWEGWKINKAGKTEWVCGVLTALYDRSGKLTGFLRISRSHTKQKILEDSLKRAAAELEMQVTERSRQLEETIAELRQKNEEVEAFVYIVSHDLRAPLVNVLGFVNELRMSNARLSELISSPALPAELRAQMREVLDDEIAGALKYISDSSSKFERLIDALLRLSRQGRQKYRISMLNVREVVEGALQALQSQIQEAGATVQIGNLPDAFADHDALGLVFAHLITNALTFRAPNRALRIAIHGTVEGEMVHFQVWDNGLGIPEAGMPRLFQIFQRLHPRQGEGEGMGLAIAHRIIERHGGKIWAESREDLETTFHFTLFRRAPSDRGTGAA